MSILRRSGLIGALSGAMVVSAVFGGGVSSKPLPQQQSAPLVDLSGASVTSQGSTGPQRELAAPIVEAASKKKKPAPSFWNRLWHPTQWFNTSKKKK